MQRDEYEDDMTCKKGNMRKAWGTKGRISDDDGQVECT